MRLAWARASLASATSMTPFRLASPPRTSATMPGHPAGPWPARAVQGALCAGIVVLLLLKFRLVPLINVNWDEFYFLSRIHELDRGELQAAFQTFHVRLFTWLLSMPGVEVDQVIAGRWFAFALRLGSCVLGFLIGRRVFGATGALLSVFATLGFSHIMRHGEAFRADPIIAFLFLASVTLLVLRPASRSAAIGAGALLALAGLISVKAVLYVPTVCVVLAVAMPAGTQSRAVITRILLVGAVGAGLWLGLFGLHAIALPGGGPEVLASSAGLAGVAGRNLAFALPAYSALDESLHRDAYFWLLVLGGTSIAFTEVLWGSGPTRRAAVMVLGFLVPLGSLFVYRNTFSYFYAAIIPSVALSSGLLAARLHDWCRSRPLLAGGVVLVLALPLAASAWDDFKLLDLDTVAPQRETLEAVRLAFPEPVPYVDRSSMVGSYPKVGLFMSTAVLSIYRAADKPVFPALFRTRPAAFVLVNAPGLDLTATWETIGNSPHRLLREDFEFLKARFVHHWGPIWVAGAELRAGPGEAAFTLPVTGPYTLEAGVAIILDGTRHEPGEVIRLAAGGHTVRAADGSGRITLRYGDHLARPTEPPSTAPLFLGLDFLDLPRPAGAG